MKKILIFTSLILLTITLNAQTGEEIFDNNCVACHVKTPPSGMGQRGTPAHREAMMKLKAPPIMKVTMKVKMVHQDKKAFVAFVTDYIENPSKEKTICNPRAVSHFGLMPAIGKSMTPEARAKVATWMYDNFSTQKACNTCSSCQGKGQSKGQGKPMKCAAGKCGAK
jgi:cytochrome c1